MAFLGRESEADQRRAERFKAFVAARSPFALVSAMMGLLSVVDFFTLVIGVVAGLGAIVSGALGLRELRQKTHLLGRRLCVTGIALGAAGLILSALFFYRFA